MPLENYCAAIERALLGLLHNAARPTGMASAESTATVAVLGCVPTDQRLKLGERLLGLLPLSRGAGQRRAQCLVKSAR